MAIPRGIDKGGISYHIETSGDLRAIETFRMELASIRKDLQDIKKLKGALRGVHRVPSTVMKTNKGITKEKKKQLDIERAKASIKKQDALLRNRELNAAKTELAILKAKKTEERARAVIRDKQVRKQRLLTDMAREEERIARSLNRLKDQKLQRSRAQVSAEQAIARFKQKQLDFEKRAAFARKAGLAGNQVALSDLGFSKQRAAAHGLMGEPKDVGILGALKNKIKEIFGIGEASENSAKKVNRLAMSLRRMVTALIFFSAARKAMDSFKEMVSGMIQFNSKLEQVRLGMASLFLAVGTIINAQGQVVKGAEGLQLALVASRQQTTMLRKEALKTVATFDELSEAFQTAIAPGLQAGLELDQIRKFTVQISQAAAAIGLPQQQLAEEIRSILQGTISVRFTRIATALGITNKDIKNAKEMGKLAEFLQDKFSAFTTAGEEALKTYSAIVTNLKDAFLLVAGAGGEGLFNTVKEQLTDIRSLIVDPKTLTPNPEAMRAFEVLSNHLSDIVKSLTGFLTQKGGMANLAEVMDTVGQSAKVVVDILLGVADAITTIVKGVNMLADTLKEVGKGFGVNKNLFRELAKILTLLFVGKSVLPVTFMMNKLVSITNSWNTSLATSIMRWGAISAAIATATVFVVKAIDRFKEYSKEVDKVRSSQGKQSIGIGDKIIRNAAQGFTSVLGFMMDEEDRKEMDDFIAGGKINQKGLSKEEIREKRIQGLISRAQEKAKGIASPTISGPANIKQLTKDIENLNLEIEKTERTTEGFVGGSAQKYLGVGKEIKNTYLKTFRQINADIAQQEKLLNKIDAKKSNIFTDLLFDPDSSVKDVSKQLERAKTAIRLFQDAEMHKELGQKTKARTATVLGEGYVDLLERSIGGIETQKFLEAARQITELDQKQTAAKVRQVELSKKKTELEGETLKLQAAKIAKIGKEQAHQIALNNATNARAFNESRINMLLDKREITSEKAVELRAKNEIQALMKIAKLEDERYTKQVVALTEKKNSLEDSLAQEALEQKINSMILEQVELRARNTAEIAQQQKHLEAIQKPETGFVTGLKDAVEELPTLTEVYRQTSQDLATGISNTLGQAVVDALDPEKKDVDIKERFMALFRDIANQAIKGIIGNAIRKVLIQITDMNKKDKGMGDSASKMILAAGLWKPVADSISKAAQELKASAIALAAVKAGSSASGATTKARGGYVHGYATGGPVLDRPAHIDHRDTIPAWLRPGEYVIRPEAVRKLGRGFLDMVNRGFANPLGAFPDMTKGMKLRSSTIRGFAEGGPVGGGSSTMVSPTSSGAPIVTPVLVTDGELMEQILQGGGDAVLRDWMDKNSDSIQTSDRRADRGNFD